MGRRSWQDRHEKPSLGYLLWLMALGTLIATIGAVAGFAYGGWGPWLGVGVGAVVIGIALLIFKYDPSL